MIHTPAQNYQSRRLQVTAEIPAALREYASILRRSTTSIRGENKLRHSAAEQNKVAAIEASNFYATDLAPHSKAIRDLPFDEIAAATDADSAGTLAGTLVLQESLPLFRYEYPLLASFYSDFSPTPGLLNQTEDTRVVVSPAVQEYDNTTGDDGRPNGWKTVTPAKAIDVPITLDTHVGVPIVFGADTLASTMRRLFEEQGPAAIYAMAKYYVAKITALMTPVNYNAYAVANGTTVPDAYSTYAVSQKSFSMDALDDLEAVFDNNEVPAKGRSILLNAKYHGLLRRDPRLSLFFAAMQKPEMVTKGELPGLNGFIPQRAPWLPSTNNMVGFAAHQAGIILKQRLPSDFTTALNVVVPGRVTTVIDAESRLSCLLVEYIDLRRGFAEWRVENLLGAGPGDKRGGLCLTSQ